MKHKFSLLQRNSSRLFLKAVKKIALLLLVIYIGLGACLFFFQRHFIYFPDNRDFDSCPFFRDSQKIYLPQTRLYYKKNSDKVFVFYHGNAGSACDRYFFKHELERLNYSYIFVEYTGYSNDSEKPSKKALLKNVEETNEFINSQKFSQVVLAGESLGAAFALYHSTLFQEEKVLLIAPFHKMSEVARQHYFFYPVNLMLKEDYDNSAWSNDLNRVKIIHGSNDKVIPPSQSEILWKKMAASQKERVIIENGGHNNIYELPLFYQEIANYLQ